MKEIKIIDGVFLWEVLPGGARAVLIGDGQTRVMINPPAAEPGIYKALLAEHPVKAIYISNKNYSEQSFSLRMDFKIPFGVHEAEVPFLRHPPDFTFKDNQDLHCGIKAVHLQWQRAAGECIFHVNASRLLAAGEVLCAAENQALKMHPAGDYQDYRKAQAGLRRLFSLDFEKFLPSRGTVILNQAYEKLTEMFEDLK